MRNPRRKRKMLEEAGGGVKGRGRGASITMIKD